MSRDWDESQEQPAQRPIDPYELIASEVPAHSFAQTKLAESDIARRREAAERLGIVVPALAISIDDKGSSTGAFVVDPLRDTFIDLWSNSLECGDRYCVIYGEEGCGKSALVEQMASLRRAGYLGIRLAPGDVAISSVLDERPVMLSPDSAAQLARAWSEDCVIELDGDLLEPAELAQLERQIGLAHGQGVPSELRVLEIGGKSFKSHPELLVIVTFALNPDQESDERLDPIALDRALAVQLEMPGGTVVFFDDEEAEHYWDLCEAAESAAWAALQSADERAVRAACEQLAHGLTEAFAKHPEQSLRRVWHPGEVVGFVCARDALIGAAADPVAPFSGAPGDGSVLRFAEQVILQSYGGDDIAVNSAAGCLDFLVDLEVSTALGRDQMILVAIEPALEHIEALIELVIELRGAGHRSLPGADAAA